MAIIIQGSKVAGVGKTGLSAYDLAKRGGYAGTEAEFSRDLNAATSFDDFLESHNTSETAHNDIRQAVSIAQAAADSKAPMYTYGTEDLIAGTSILETGTLYFVYE